MFSMENILATNSEILCFVMFLLEVGLNSKISVLLVFKDILMVASPLILGGT